MVFRILTYKCPKIDLLRKWKLQRVARTWIRICIGPHIKYSLCVLSDHFTVFLSNNKNSGVLTIKYYANTVIVVNNNT